MYCPLFARSDCGQLPDGVNALDFGNKDLHWRLMGQSECLRKEVHGCCKRNACHGVWMELSEWKQMQPRSLSELPSCADSVEMCQ